MKQYARQSNFELLRIVAMALIIVHHFLIATGSVDYRTGRLCGGEWLNAFCVVGVNCFILISGYFGIGFRFQKVVYLLYSVACVALVDMILGKTGYNVFDSDYALKKIVPFVKGCNWFLPAYMALMFISPVLNKAIYAASVTELRKWVILLGVVNAYAYFCNVGAVNANGYTIFHFIFIYILGAFLRKTTTVRGCVAVALFLIGTAGSFVVSQAIKTGYTAFAYNSPQVLVASVGLFMLFIPMKIQNRIVNNAAQAMFTVFLFHYIILKSLKTFHSVGAIICAFVAVFLAAYLLHILIKCSYEMCRTMCVDFYTFAKKHIMKH